MMQPLSLTPAERVVRDAAEQRGGGFHAHLYSAVSKNQKAAALSDGHIAYLLGAADPEFLRSMLADMPHDSVLGRAELLRDVLSERGYLLIPKDFAFLKTAGANHAPDLPESVAIKPVSTPDELRAFCSLKAAFLSEESGTAVSPDALFAELEDVYHGIKPVIMTREGKAIGMACSHLHSRASAMINMLYIAQGERAKGYGSLCVRWYMAYLLAESASLCLFYSPGNAPAVQLYGNLGFEKKEDWMLAIKK
jgi:GNAT superfamily N-acetyltransferase